MKSEHITFGGGCFWCTEAVFRKITGVTDVTPGYAGGNTDAPTYEIVSTGLTGHAEVIQIEYDASAVSLTQLLNVFFASHDPTTRNRQGNDVGPQYRSIILYSSDEQKEVIETYIAARTERGEYEKPIVTEVAPLTTFYPAEEYHMAYYATHPNDGYSQAVIAPKVAKIRKTFGDLLKTE